MKLLKQDCNIKMRLVPIGAGWTYVFLDICGDNHKFIISDVIGNQFYDLMFMLYHLYPDNCDPENAYHNMDYAYVLCKNTTNGYKAVSIVDNDYVVDDSSYRIYQIAYKGEFTWDEEGGWSNWIVEREPTLDNSFDLIIRIEHLGHNDEAVRKYDYKVSYRDFCYAVAKACTETIKKHGFLGYHHAVSYHDMNIRHLLFLKCIALRNFEACELTYYADNDHGETSEINKEIELLLFEM